MPSANDAWYLALIACWSSVVSFCLIAVQAFIQGTNPIGDSSAYLWRVYEDKALLLTPFDEGFDATKYAKMVHTFIFGFGGLSIFPAIQMLKW